MPGKEYMIGSAGEVGVQMEANYRCASRSDAGGDASDLCSFAANVASRFFTVNKSNTHPGTQPIRCGRDFVLQLSRTRLPRNHSERENAGCEPISKVLRGQQRTEEKKRTQEGYIQGAIHIEQQKTPCVTRGFLAPRAGLELIAVPRICSNLAILRIPEFYEFHVFHALHRQGCNYGTVN